MLKPRLPDSVKTAFFSVLFIFILLYIFTKLFGPIPFSINSVNTTKTDLFTVSGEGKATAIPDTAIANFGVTKTASSVENAKNDTNTAMNNIISGLKNLGIKDKKITTTNYSILPNYDYNASRNTIAGYTVTQNLQVEITPIEKANQAVDVCTANGANMVGSIQFTVNDEKKLELENSARADAINKAKTKAENIARVSGIRLGRLINVSESSPFNPPLMYSAKAADSVSTGSETQLQAGENTVTITVTLSYETY
jgi:uncharacterized protein